MTVPTNGTTSLYCDGLLHFRPNDIRTGLVAGWVCSDEFLIKNLLLVLFCEHESRRSIA